MLLRFRAANVYSLRDEQELSFVATEFNEGSARDTDIKNGGPVRVLPVAGIYGANASGKSNVVAALRFMRDAVLSSHAQWATSEGVPRPRFALDPKATQESSLLEADIVIEGVRYTYGFELSDTRVEAEWLHAYPHVRRQVWFEREAARAQPFHFPGEHLKGARSTLAKMTRDNALFLSVAAANNHPQLTPILRWFAANLWLVSPEPGGDLPRREAFTRERLDGPMRSRIEELLRVADLGILRVETVPGDDGGPPRMRFVHATEAGDAPLDFEKESLGTRSWFALLGPVLLALDEGAVLLVDELDASLHPRLATEVVRLFQDREANPHVAQLVFTSHDASVLGNEPGGRPLDRDQIWLTSKDRSGATELYCLTDAKPRKQENLERGYLSGRYGGTPDLSPGEIVGKVRQLHPVKAAR